MTKAGGIMVPGGPSTLTADIAVVGLGPVGAAAANLAAASGFKTVVLDRDDAPFAQPRAIVFDAEVMRIFASFGLASTIEPITRPLGGSVYLGADGRRIRTFRSPGPSYPGGWAPSNLFYQPELETKLRNNLAVFAGMHVETGCVATGVENHAAGARVLARRRDGSELVVEARYVLACDGASSTLRKALGIGLEDIGFEERWLVLDALMKGPMRWPGKYDIPPEVRDGGFSLMICDPAGPATIIPGRGDHRRWEYMLSPAETDADAVSPDALARRLSDWADPAAVEVVRTAVYRFRALMARRWRNGSVFLLGDAAHQTPPFFGQGMCHGVRDAAQLIWKLRLVEDGRAEPDLLDSYQAEREPHVREIITASVAAGAAVCITDPDQARARDEEFRALEAAREGKAVAMTDVVPPIRAGLIRGPGGGQRLPEFPVKRDGRTGALDDHLANRFTLLSTTPVDTRAAAPWARWRALGGQELVLSANDGGALIDVDGRFADWMKRHPAQAVLVRPDRYLFGAGDPVSLIEDLLDALAATSSSALETSLP